MKSPSDDVNCPPSYDDSRAATKDLISARADARDVFRYMLHSHKICHMDQARFTQLPARQDMNPLDLPV